MLAHVFPNEEHVASSQMTHHARPRRQTASSSPQVPHRGTAALPVIFLPRAPPAARGLGGVLPPLEEHPHVPRVRAVHTQRPQELRAVVVGQHLLTAQRPDLGRPARLLADHLPTMELGEVDRGGSGAHGVLLLGLAVASCCCQPACFAIALMDVARGPPCLRSWHSRHSGWRSSSRSRPNRW